MKKYLIIFVLGLVGLYGAIELSIPAYQYWNSENASVLQSLPCDISATLSCSGILQNPRSIIFSLGDFKIAFPLIALAVYPILIIISLIGYFRKSVFEAKILSVLALGGMAFNGYIISQEIIVGVFCPLCAMCSVVITIIFFVSIFIWKK